MSHLDPEYDEYVRCLDGIPDISVLLDDDNEDPTASATICPAAPEPAPKRSKPSLNRKRGLEPSIVTAVSEPLKDETNTRFAIPVTSLERKKAAKGVIPTNTEASTRWAI